MRTSLALTLGDINGIGPEIILKALRHEAIQTHASQYILIGPYTALRYYADLLGFSLEAVPVVHAPEAIPPGERMVIWDIAGGEAPPVHPGHCDPRAGRWAMEAVARAVDLCMSGRASAMVTAPIAKAAIRQAGFDVPGHTEYLARRTGSQDVLMIMVAGSLRVALVTIHIPLREVPDRVDRATVMRKARLFHRSLQQDFGLATPRLALLGLNPHAGEEGHIGHEEQTILKPALASLRKEGLDIHGPFPADSFFGRHRAHFDGVLAMYHDQGLGPFKALAFERGVNVTAGLPIVRTSPDHGTAFAIAGKGVASETSMVEAILLADRMARHRQHVVSP